MTHILNWQDLTPATFLSQYWQKKPLIIKNAFQDFNDPIDANDLAGLAMEDFIESRIISKTDAKWDVNHGPFTDFSQFGEKNWTLLVQAVNNWFADVDALIKPFNFIPNWRIDDVMVSFSTPGGGVGPHLDQYDVFILQGEGKRRWRVGKPDASLKQLLPHEDLKQVSDFIAEIDEITEPGDLLYIPPNHPHDGVAIDNSLNYSIGFQAPNPQELLGVIADHLLDADLLGQRMDDRKRQLTHKPHELEPNDIKQLTEMVQNALTDADMMTTCFAKYLTSVHHSLNLLVPVEPLDIDLIKQIFAEGEILEPVLGIKCLLVNQNDNSALYINGEKFELMTETLELGQMLAQKMPLSAQSLEKQLDCLKNQHLLTRVINKGFWCFE
ncbi:JmjC domain-containing protein [Thalassotalea aquiviva]|uniref:JmjC domain-containing protein n=1 Tax=Thalassotalea aquiviva TaxID=3242415 RepID=UPI00352AF729